MFGIFSKVNSISTDELSQEIRNGGQVIDVREPYEFNRGHIIGARNIPLGQIDSISLAQDKKYFVICQSGMRSRKAYKILRKKELMLQTLMGECLRGKEKRNEKENCHYRRSSWRDVRSYKTSSS